ncbi:MAG: hypothetical protein HY900_27615 [Deltaproteobacteria bacterium]|nr:hypothetical protein [Deltaproteobacteria bacterium]
MTGNGKLLASALALASLGLAACTAGSAGSRRAAAASCTVESILSFSERYGGLGQKEAEAAYAETRAAFQRTGSECDRLRLAFLLSHPEGKGHRDDAHALRLLTAPASAGGPKDPALASLSKYAADTLASRTDLDARCRVSMKKLVDERARADSLQRKIDGLRQIEELLQQRQRN